MVCSGVLSFPTHVLCSILLCFFSHVSHNSNGLAAGPKRRRPEQTRIVAGNGLDRSYHCYHCGFNEDVFAAQDQGYRHRVRIDEVQMSCSEERS